MQWITCVCADAEAVGGAIAGLLAAPLYGVGADWLKTLMPWQKHKESPVGPNGRLVDFGHSQSKKDRVHNYMHHTNNADSIGTVGSADVEQQPLETLV